MNLSFASKGLLVVAMLAAVGFFMIYLPPQVIAQYKTVAEFGKPFKIIERRQICVKSLIPMWCVHHAVPTLTHQTTHSR